MSLFSKAAALIGMSAAFAKRQPVLDQLFIKPEPKMKYPNWLDTKNGPANSPMHAPRSYFNPPSQRQRRKAARRLRHLN